MNKSIILGMVWLLLMSFSYAIYENETISIPALYLENSIPTDCYANITIEDDSNNAIINNVAMVNETNDGEFTYNYTFVNSGNYLTHVDFYSFDWDSLGSVEEWLFVEENYTIELNNITEIVDNISFTVESNNNILTNIWDWIQTTIFDNKNYKTSIYGKIEQYSQVLFYTESNFVLTQCEILINTETYNMTIDNKIATKYYYLSDGGTYDWNVTCN